MSDHFATARRIWPGHFSEVTEVTPRNTNGKHRSWRRMGAPSWTYPKLHYCKPITKITKNEQKTSHLCLNTLEFRAICDTMSKTRTISASFQFFIGCRVTLHHIIGANIAKEERQLLTCLQEKCSKILQHWHVCNNLLQVSITLNSEATSYVTRL